MAAGDIQTNKELIRLFDLQARWKGALNEDIIELCETKKLTSYWLKADYGEMKIIKPYTIKCEVGAYMGTDAFIPNNQVACVFYLEDVEEIEKEYPHFLLERKDLTKDINGRDELISSEIIEDMKHEYNKKLEEQEKKYEAKIEKLEAQIEEQQKLIEQLRQNGIEDCNYSKGISKVSYRNMVTCLLLKNGITKYDDDAVETVFNLIPEVTTNISEKVQSFNKKTIERVFEDLCSEGYLKRSPKISQKK